MFPENQLFNSHRFWQTKIHEGDRRGTKSQIEIGSDGDSVKDHADVAKASSEDSASKVMIHKCSIVHTSELLKSIVEGWGPRVRGGGGRCALPRRSRLPVRIRRESGSRSVGFGQTQSYFFNFWQTNHYLPNYYCFLFRTGILASVILSTRRPVMTAIRGEIGP